MPPDLGRRLPRATGTVARVRGRRRRRCSARSRVADRPRETAREAIELLRAHGIRHVAMLTGDHAGRARAPSPTRVGVDEYHAGLLPEQKHARVRRCARRTVRC